MGLYGVMSYAIARRTGEIGVRVAHGAQPNAVVRLVLADSLRLVMLGLAIGLPLALAAVRLLGSQLHGVGTEDPLSIGASLLARGQRGGSGTAPRAARVTGGAGGAAPAGVSRRTGFAGPQQPG
ncbi:MAG TPA: FtsX-like permease family protein [Gemmatimonadaceae bacterium]|nr:FtsX-like permease family protein [Gemmatimonadaceae bacterium]